MKNDPSMSSAAAPGQNTLFFRLGEYAGLRLEHFGGVIYRKKLFDFREVNHFGALVCRLLEKGPRSIPGLARELSAVYPQSKATIEKDIRAFLQDLPGGYLQMSKGDHDETLNTPHEIKELASGLEEQWDKLPEQPFYPAPLQFHWEITHQCNLRCLHCYASSAAVGMEEVDTLDWERCVRLLETFRDMGVVQVNFLGGEPLIEKRFLPLLERAVEYGMDITFPTNGVLLTDEKIRELKRLGMHYLTISLDSPDPATFEKMRGQKGVFEKVTDAITRVREQGLEVVVNSVLTKINHEQFPELIDLLVELDVAILKVIDEFPVGRGMANIGKLLLSQQEYQDFYTFMLSEVEPAYRDRLEIRLNPRFTFLGTGGEEDPAAGKAGMDYRCSAGRSQCFCTTEGKVYPCYLFYDEDEFLAGNVYQRPFDEIWNDPESFACFRELVGTVEDCQSCECAGTCKGGCRGEAYKLTGDFLAKNPYCWHA